MSKFSQFIHNSGRFTYLFSGRSSGVSYFYFVTHRLMLSLLAFQNRILTLFGNCRLSTGFAKRYRWFLRQYVINRPKTLFGDTPLLLRLGLTGISAYVFWGCQYWASWTTFLGVSLLMFLLQLGSGVLLKKITDRVIKRFPEPHQAPQRVCSQAVMFVLTGLLMAQLMLHGFNALQLFGFVYNPATAPWILATVAITNLMMAGLSEGRFAFSQWRTNQLEFQQLEQQQVQAQLDEVKQQINPHFLFNSLNSLSVLISDDPVRAERFVDEMSSVYRYILQVGQHNTSGNLVTLGAELRFLNAYAYLLQTRYGTGFNLSIDVAESAKNQWVPSLSLQTLVDNAIKHNIVSVAKPLNITIRTTPTGQLHVQNTLQKRSVRIALNRAGLSTLIARYRLLGNKSVRVLADESTYTVELPLLNV